MPSQPKNTMPRRKFRTQWGELEYLCAVIHRLWYAQGNKGRVKKFLARLEKLLAELPPNDMAILREDGLALLSEITGRIDAAIKHRKREIKLMEKLHKDVASRDYADDMKASILVNRDAETLQERRDILQKLQHQTARNGPAGKPSRQKQAQ